MKKTLLLVGLALTTAAQGAGKDYLLKQLDPTETYSYENVVSVPAASANGVFIYNGTANSAHIATLSGCSLAGNVFTCGSAGTVSSVGVTSSNLTVTGSPVTTSGSIAVSLPNAGTASTYSGITTDAQGRVTSGTNRSQTAQTRTLNSGFQISSVRDALVSYSAQMTVTATIAGGQDGDLFLEIASDSGFTSNLQTVGVSPCSQSYSLAVALQGVQKCALNVSGYVPAGYYTRLRTAANTGTPAFSYRAGQEVLL